MADIPNGRLCWYELLTTDPESAQNFYPHVVGWTTGQWDAGANPYTMWLAGDVGIGGVMQLPDEAVARGAPSHWLMYVSTPDIRATADKATELGAEVMTELNIPEVGDIAVVQDPQGAMFAAYQPSGEAPGHDGPPNLGEVSWHELLTTDWEAAFAFYSELFGWQEADHMDMGEMGRYQMFSRGAHQLGGMMNRPPDMPVTAWLLYFHVADVAEAVEKVREHGGQVFNGPMEVPGGDIIAQGFDPQGSAFALHAKKAG